MFEICGHYNSVVIGKSVSMKNAVIHLGDYGSSFCIGNNTDIGGGFHVSILEGASASIGNDCMFSLNTSIMNSDSHSIIDLSTDTRINRAEDVVIGNHVWFGQDVTVLKGAKILDNTVIGNRSMVMKGIYDGNSVYVGTLARSQGGGYNGCVKEYKNLCNNGDFKLQKTGRESNNEDSIIWIF